MKLLKISNILLIFFLSVSSIYSVPLELITENGKQDFPFYETVEWEDDTIPILDLLPDVPGSEIIRDRFFTYKPKVAVQRLYRFELRNSIDSSVKKKRLFVSILNAFGDPENQEEYTYHSATRDKDIKLIEDTYICDKKGNRENTFTYSEKNIPSEIEYYQYVDEANFSGQIFRQKIQINENYLTFHSTNTERIWVSILPILAPKETRNELLAFIEDNYLYIYNSTQIVKVPAARKLGLPIHLPTMFKKRMDVMTEWLTDELSLWITTGFES